MIAALALALAVTPTAALLAQLQPALPAARVAYLAGSIDYSAARHGVQPRLLAAILYRESGFRSGIRRCDSPDGPKRRCNCDFGIAQVNDVVVAAFGLDAARLEADDAYGIDSAARILAWIRTRYGYEPTWYGRYHSARPAQRAAYEALLLPILVRS